MKFVMRVKNIKKTCNSMIRFSKYVTMLIFLVRVVGLGYN